MAAVVVGTVLAQVVKGCIESSRSSSSDDGNDKKVVAILEKLVKAKNEALSDEINRRKEAEEKVEELRKELEKIQVASDTTDDRDQVKSQLFDVLLEELSSKRKQQLKSDGKRGGWRGRGRGHGRGGRGGGPFGEDIRRKGDEYSQSRHAKFNNNNNIKPNKGENTKVFNRLSFDDLPSASKMQNDGKAQFFQQPPEKNVNNPLCPFPGFHQTAHFPNTPVYGPGNQFPHPWQLPNQCYMQPNFGPQNAPFPPQNVPFTPQNVPFTPQNEPFTPQNVPFTPQNVPLPPQFNFPPPQLNIPPQGFGLQMNNDGLTLGKKKLTPQELNDIKQCLKNDKTNMRGHIQHNRTAFKTCVQKQKQYKDKNGENITRKENEGENVGIKKVEKTVGKKDKDGEKVTRKENEGIKAAVKKSGGDKDEENSVGKKKQVEQGKVKQVAKTGQKQKEDGDNAEKDAQKLQGGSSTGARKKELMEEKKQVKKKNKNQEALGGGSSAKNPIQLLVKTGIPTEAEIRSKNMDIDMPIKDFMLVAKDGDKPVSEVPSTLKDMLNFKRKYPNAYVIIIQDQ